MYFKKITVPTALVAVAGERKFVEVSFLLKIASFRYFNSMLDLCRDATIRIIAKEVL